MPVRESLGDELFALSASDGTTPPLAHSAVDRILIADDVEDNVWLLQALLTQSGYEHVYSTTDSREVMQMYAELQPDIVLLDVHMPGVDGLTLIRELRASEPERHVPADRDADGRPLVEGQARRARGRRVGLHLQAVRRDGSAAPRAQSAVAAVAALEAHATRT